MIVDELVSGYILADIWGCPSSLANLFYTSNDSGLWKIYLHLPWFIYQLETGGIPIL